MSLEDWPEDGVDGSIKQQPPLLSATSSGTQPKLGGLVLPDVPQDAGPMEGYAGVVVKPGAGRAKASKVCGLPLLFASVGEICGPFHQRKGFWGYLIHYSTKLQATAQQAECCLCIFHGGAEGIRTPLSHLNHARGVLCRRRRSARDAN